MYSLRCPGCGATDEHLTRAKICVSCGNIMTEIPLTNSDFEAIGEDHEPAKKPMKTKEQTVRPDGAGRVF